MQSPCPFIQYYRIASESKGNTFSEQAGKFFMLCMKVSPTISSWYHTQAQLLPHQGGDAPHSNLTEKTFLLGFGRKRGRQTWS